MVPPAPRLWLLLLLLATQGVTSVISNIEEEMHVLPPHCNDFLQYCSFQTNTSSCTFMQSVTFMCGQRPIKHERGTNVSTYGSSSASGSFHGSTNGNDDSDEAVVEVPESFDCLWNVAGDLIVAPNVHVNVTGDDCFLQISAGKMLLLQQSAALYATSIRVSASFVRLEANAEVAATYSGMFYNQSGFFTGNDIYGASNGGSGGQRLLLAEAEKNGAFGGFFDVREKIISNRLVRNTAKLLEDASAAWALAPFWNDKTVVNILNDNENTTPTTSLHYEEDPDVVNARFLLGSGSCNGKICVNGGGRIKITASKDLVMMPGTKITANGDAAQQGVAGGSGGSIVLVASALSVSGEIQAKGGDAFCDSDVKKRGIFACYPAGGGGRVQISYQSSQLSDTAVDTTGGRLKSGDPDTIGQTLQPTQVAALSGAGGTYYRVSRRADGTAETELIVRNRLKNVDATTDTDDGFDGDSDQAVGGAVTSVNVVGKHHDLSIDSFIVTDGAILSSHCLRFKEGDLDVRNGSYLVQSLPSTSSENKLDIQVRDLLVTAQSNFVLPTAILKLRARSVAMDATTALYFGNSVHVMTKQYLHLDGNVSSAIVNLNSNTSKLLSVESQGDVILGGIISVGGLFISTDHSINVTGRMEATNVPSLKSSFLSCKDQNLDTYEYDPLKSTIRNFTMVLNAQQSIFVGQAVNPAVMRAGAALICAHNTIELVRNSIVTASGMGEMANQGPGSGSCVGSVGGGGGYGGRGADSGTVNPKGDYASGGLPYGMKSGAGMLGSGGGCVGGGRGGGVVMIGTAGFVLNGGIYCNGDGGANGGGGGSGGFLGLSISQYLKGHGRISAVGGGSQCAEAVVTIITSTSSLEPTGVNTTNANSKTSVGAHAHVTPRLCGGGGGGGRLQLTGCEKSDFDQCTNGFDGNYTVAGGSTSLTIGVENGATVDGADAPSVIKPASSGSFFGFPCAPGSGGLFCRPCEVGTYKSESNSDECKPCKNAPSNSHYVGKGSITADCKWTCDPGYSGYYCVSPLQQLLDACGGEFGFALVLMSIVAFFILLGYACRNRKEPSYTRAYHGSRTKGERQHLLSSAVANSQKNRFAFLWRCFYWPRVAYPKLTERDLPEHMARIYFDGLNEPDSPLALRTTVPLALKAVLYDDEFKKFAERINSEMAWRRGCCSSWGRVFYALIALLCYPFASEVMLYRRHLRVNTLKRIIAKYNHACMKGPRARGLLNAVKLGYSADYSLVYLELLYKESSQSVCVPTTKIGKPSLPVVLLFAGCGTYFSPFYLDPNDLLVRSIPQCPELTAFIDEPWIEFVAELNELLRVVQRDQASFVKSLIPVAKFLERKMTLAATGNGKLGGLRIFLGRFYARGEEQCEEFKLGLFLTTGTGGEGNHSSNDIRQLSTSQQQGSSNNTPKRTYGLHKDPGYGYNTGSYSRNFEGGPMEPRGKNDSFGNADSLLYDLSSSPWRSSAVGGGPPRLGRRGSLGTMNRGGSGMGAGGNMKHPVSSIREEALRIRSSTSGSMDATHVNPNGRGGDELLAMVGPQHKAPRRRTFYEGWLGPVDASLPVPGVLITADELEDRLADRPRWQVVESFLKLHLLPCNVPLSSRLNLSWMLSISLLSLLMVDLAITFAMVVNLKCVTNGQVDQDCSASIMIPVLLLPPLTLIVSPIMGIVSLALSSSTFSRRYSIWNVLSIVNVVVAIFICIYHSKRLVAPWFAGPLPLLPAIALGVKAGEAYVIERYIAFQETHRRRRGWRGLMKRRLSDASIPPESP